MGLDTLGRIHGYVSHIDILNFIRQKYDSGAIDETETRKVCPLSEVTWDYVMNPHSTDNKNWVGTEGFIRFKYNGRGRLLFYFYNNINTFENLEYYKELGLEEVVTTETTHVSLGYDDDAVKIIKEIVAHFGGGWVDENDCDDVPYCPIFANEDGTIKPVIHVTMEQIQEHFGKDGSIVVIDSPRYSD